MQSKKPFRKVLPLLMCLGLLGLPPVVKSATLRGAGKEKSQHLKLEKLPYTFDFDRPGYPKPSLVFKGPFPKVPQKMIIYQVKHPKVTEASVRKYAQEYFGMSPDAELKRSRRLRLYWLKTPDQRLEVNPSNGSFNIRKIMNKNPQTSIDKGYPSRAECEQLAKEYLRARNLLPKEAYLRGIADNTGPFSLGVMSVGFGRKIGNHETWGAGAKILVDIAPGGEVVEVRKTWQQLIPYKPYPIKTPAEALEELRNGKGVLMHGSKGEVKKITFRYYTSPVKQDYVQPCYYFECAGPKRGFYGLVPAIKPEYLESRPVHRGAKRIASQTQPAKK